ncbi:MAG TPA: ParB N-terminal domain-containing protein [Vicinamibacterales bacterium]|nr:ParB N-terminal domain-containing protein [Vicinamibacterales bacterium]
MRADAHYVDQLESPAQPVIRLLTTAQIECRDLPPPDCVEALAKSIALHGVLQPLIIRRHAGRYSLIAGRKRLAAAVAAGLSAVPCLLHEVDASGAAAIAAADNLRFEDSSAPGGLEGLLPLLQAVSSDLSAIRTSMTLLRATRPGSLSQQVGADLIEAQARRAAWLVGSMTGTFENNRLVPLGAIIQRVADGFDAHATLTGLQLECSVTPSAAVWKLPEGAATAVIDGAVFATLRSLDGVARPVVKVQADTPHPRMVKIEVVQRAVRVPPGLGEGAGQPDAGRLAELSPALALRMARTVAAAHGGTVELTPLPGLGGVLQITFAATDPVT